MKKNTKKKILLFIMLLVSIGILIRLLVYLYRNNKTVNDEKQKSSLPKTNNSYPPNSWTPTWINTATPDPFGIIENPNQVPNQLNYTRIQDENSSFTPTPQTISISETNIVGSTNDTSSITIARCPPSSFVKTLEGQQTPIRSSSPTSVNGSEPNISFFKIVCSDSNNTSFQVGTNNTDMPVRPITFTDGWSKIQALNGRTTISDENGTTTEMNAITGLNGYRYTNSTSSSFSVGGANALSQPYLSCNDKIRGFELGTKNNLLTYIRVLCE